MSCPPSGKASRAPVPARPESQLFKDSTLGQTLMDAIDELVVAEKIPPQLAAKILNVFLSRMDQRLGDLIPKGACIRMHGPMDSYNFVDGYWQFRLRDLKLFLDQGEPAWADKLRIIAIPSPEEAANQGTGPQTKP